MEHFYEDWELDLICSDSEFLRKMGIKPCVIYDLRPERRPLSCPEDPHVRLTERDVAWLKACGVAWEEKPAFQPPLDFCGHQDIVREN